MDYRSLSIGNWGTTGSSAQCCRLWPTFAGVDNGSVVRTRSISKKIIWVLEQKPRMCRWWITLRQALILLLSMYWIDGQLYASAFHFFFTVRVCFSRAASCAHPPKKSRNTYACEKKARNRCLCYLPLVWSWRYLLFSRSCNDPSLSVALVTFIRSRKKAETAASTRRKHNTHQTDGWWGVILVTASNSHPLATTLCTILMKITLRQIWVSSRVDPGGTTIL